MKAHNLPSEADMKAFNNGERAYLNGSPHDANPYPPIYGQRLSFADWWTMGWNNAENDREVAERCPDPWDTSE